MAYKSQDFHDRNILTYCFDKKKHKAHEYRQRNDHMLELIKDQFISKDSLIAQEELRLKQFTQLDNQRKIEADENKRNTRKQ